MPDQQKLLGSDGIFLINEHFYQNLKRNIAKNLLLIVFIIKNVFRRDGAIFTHRPQKNGNYHNFLMVKILYKSLIIKV